MHALGEGGRVHGERVCIWKGWSVHMEGVECAYGRGEVCMDGEREDVCIWKG